MRFAFASIRVSEAVVKALLIVCIGTSLTGTCLQETTAAGGPNFLVILADDATFSDLPLYGGENVATPRIDELASQGMRFTQAYVNMSMCVPCRSELYTGLYPMRNGACWNHSPVHPGTKSIVHHLGDRGYRVGIAGKVHVTPRGSFPFEMVGGFERGCVKATADHECSGIRKFMTRDDDQPFCLVVALVVPHVVWTVGDPSHFDPAKLKLPPYLADTPQTREDFARYLAEIEVLDQQVGDIVDTLEEAGHDDDTMVLFSSEQGAQFPGCKWTVWDQGVHTAMIVRWPGRVQAGASTDALVQYADVLPTLLDVAGAEDTDGADPAEMGFDGSSFLPVLLGEEYVHRQYVYAMHNNVPEGPPYPIRSVRDRHYRYIRNLSPDRLYIERHVMGVDKHNPYWATWMFDAGDDPHTYAMLQRYMKRPAEQLYHTSEDPFELHNLAEDPSYAGIKIRLLQELDRWMQQQGDPGADLDTQKALEARRKAVRKRGN